MKRNETDLSFDEMEKSSKGNDKESALDKALDIIPFQGDGGEDDESYLSQYDGLVQQSLDEEDNKTGDMRQVPHDIYYRQISEIPLLSAEEERKIAEKAFNGDIEARNELIEHSLRLVGFVVKKYAGRAEKDDLIQEGNAGLCQAAERYDYRKGFRFSTYAVWWIRRSIVRYIAAQGHPLALPEKGHRDAATILRAIEVYREQHNDASPSIQELSDITGMSQTRIRDLMTAATIPLSIDTPNPKKEGSTFEEIIPDKDSESPVEASERSELSELLTQAIEKNLNTKDRHMVELRYGFADGQPHSLEDIGKEFGVSRQRVQIVDKNARQKILESKFGGAIREYAGQA